MVPKTHFCQNTSALPWRGLFWLKGVIGILESKPQEVNQQRTVWNQYFVLLCCFSDCVRFPIELMKCPQKQITAFLKDRGMAPGAGRPQRQHLAEAVLFGAYRTDASLLGEKQWSWLSLLYPSTLLWHGLNPSRNCCTTIQVSLAVARLAVLDCVLNYAKVSHSLETVLITAMCYI